MARWRGQEPGPQIPAWVRHETDGGFVVADWLEPGDFQLEPGDFQLEPAVAESRARGRWIAARCDWLNANLDVADLLLEQLRERARGKLAADGDG